MLRAVGFWGRHEPSMGLPVKTAERIPRNSKSGRNTNMATTLGLTRRAGTTLLLGALGLTAAFMATAQAPAGQKSAVPASADPRVELASKIPGAKPDDLRQSPIPGIYQLTKGADIAYVTDDGKYAITGDLYDIASNDNLTEKTRRAERVKLIGAVPESQMVVFSPKDPKYTVTVFTDVDCGYCRKLHSQIADYNRLGIKVRYMFYPRSGPNTESWEKAEQVWCSANRGEALTKAKRDEALKAPTHCGGSPVAREYALGQDVGVQGTPSIVLDDGEMLGGYLPPAMLAQHLKKKS
jgi:thiol:disulfide interchange protein DsbC